MPVDVRPDLRRGGGCRIPSPIAAEKCLGSVQDEPSHCPRYAWRDADVCSGTRVSLGRRW